MRLNRGTLEQKFKNDRRIQVLPGEGGWTAILEIQSEKSDEALALHLLAQYDLITYPGYFFDFGQGNFIVLSLLLPSKIFQEGINRLWEGLGKDP